MESKYIKLVGLELEGGWDCNEVSELEKEDSCYHSDGSVSCSGNVTGEIVSTPLPIGNAVQWLEEFYPTHMNQTCGFHIHVSLKNEKYYSWLMDKVFYRYYLKEMEKFGNDYPVKNSSFWSRLKGNNNYCRKKWDADKQSGLRDKDSYRYTHVNFCYSLHKTVEFRLLPLFKEVTTAKAAMLKTFEIIETHISNMEKKKERAQNIKIPMDDLTAGTETITFNERVA